MIDLDLDLWICSQFKCPLTKIVVYTACDEEQFNVSFQLVMVSIPLTSAQDSVLGQRDVIHNEDCALMVCTRRILDIIIFSALLCQ